MICFHHDCLELSLPVARALAAFASKDDTRPLGVGLRDGALCATDGHRLVRFERGYGYQFNDGTGPLDRHEGKLWSRAYVETAVKVARAQKLASVRLPYADMLADYVMPPVSQVVPDAGFEARNPVGFNPDYIGDLALVCKACDCKGAMLSGLRGELDPIRFEIGGTEFKATALVMPMRI